jgi:hypothetical protein
LRSRLTSKIFLFAEGEKEILSPKKDFLKICGSNLALKDTTLLVTYKKPFDLVAKSKGSLVWRRLCNEIRNFYRQIPLLNFNLPAPGGADLYSGA